MKQSKPGGWAQALPFLLPSALGLLVFSLLPLGASLVLSLTSWDGLSVLTADVVKETWVGLGNFGAVLGGAEFWRVLSNTFYFIVLYVPFILGTALAVSMLLNVRRPGVGVFRVLSYIPVLTSWVAGALIWKWILSPEYGLINDLLAMVGVQGPGWLLDRTWAMPGIVLTSLWKDAGYFALILLGGLQGISPSFYESAELDGAGPWVKFTRITLPMLSPILFLVVMITLINSFQLFPQIMIMTTRDGLAPGEPLGATQVMVERIYTYAFKYYRMGLASAWAWLLFAVISLFTLLQFRVQKKWVTYDA